MPRRTGASRRRLPYWLGRTGLWQAAAVLLALVVAGLGTVGCIHAEADLRAYRLAAEPGCRETAGGPPCLVRQQVTVDRVVRRNNGDDRASELTVEFPDGATYDIGFSSDVPLSRKVSIGSKVWVDYLPDGPITGVSDDADAVQYGGREPTPTRDSPVYGPWLSLSWVVAGICVAAFFGWRAWLVRTGRDDGTGQDRFRFIAGALAAVTAIIALANADSPSTFGGSTVLTYAVVAALLAVADLVVRLITGPVDIRPVRRARRSAAPGPRVARSFGVTAACPPALAALVASVAATIGVRTPDRIVLGAPPEIRLWVDPRRGHAVELSVGAPLAMALTEDDLRVVLAHTLAILGEPVEHRADRAARQVTPLAGDALAALVRCGVLARDFGQFCEDFIPTPTRLIFPSRLYSGWLVTLRRKSPPWRSIPSAHPDDVATDVAAHPGLASVVFDPHASQGLWGSESWGGEGRPPAMTTMPAEDELALSRQYLTHDSEPDCEGPFTPADWSAYDADEIGRQEYVRPGEVATTTLGHVPTPEEMLTRFETDGGHALAEAVAEDARRSINGTQLAESIREMFIARCAVSTGEVLAGLTVEVLHEHGYRHRDVLHPELIYGPNGHEVDVDAVVTQALASASGLQHLRRLLTAGA